MQQLRACKIWSSRSWWLHWFECTEALAHGWYKTGKARTFLPDDFHSIKSLWLCEMIVLSIGRSRATFINFRRWMIYPRRYRNFVSISRVTVTKYIIVKYRCLSPSSLISVPNYCLCTDCLYVEIRYISYISGLVSKIIRETITLKETNFQIHVRVECQLGDRRYFSMSKLVVKLSIYYVLVILVWNIFIEIYSEYLTQCQYAMPKKYIELQ